MMLPVGSESSFLPRLIVAMARKIRRAGWLQRYRHARRIDKRALRRGHGHWHQWEVALFQRRGAHYVYTRFSQVCKLQSTAWRRALRRLDLETICNRLPSMDDLKNGEVSLVHFSINRLWAEWGQ